MKSLEKTQLKRLIQEFMRYILVGGIAFVADSGSLFLLREFLFKDENGLGLFISAALGFVIGLITNYILSVLFVFRGEDNKNSGKSVESFIVFAVIGVVGLGLTELGMYVGVFLMHMHYLFTKIIVAGIVLVWNYSARKILVFGRGNAQ
ncbi:MAG: GtrA family protein [Ruminiclostridium sp.]|nr:GtrA family protein [Ruminiclostridium sp.]